MHNDDFSFCSYSPNEADQPLIHQAQWKRALKYVFQSKVSIACIIFICAIILLSIIAPYLSDYDYFTTNMSVRNSSPNYEHLFGTDQLGRDLWMRVWTGTKISIIIGIFGAIIPQIIGVIVGSIAGYCGGWIDIIVMSIVDIGMCIPSLVYITLISLFIGTGPASVIIAIAISSWMETARIIRSRVIQFKNREFILAAKMQGASGVHIIVRHILPNILGQIVVSIISSIPTAIFTEAYLSFIGLGVASPLTSLGQLCKTGVSLFRLYPYQLFIPGTIISTIILSFYLIGNRIRDAVDPHYIESGV